jgi:hypothetical protein
MAEIADEGVEVSRAGRHVDEHGRRWRITKATLVGNDDFKASIGQRLDVAPEDPLGRWPTMREHQRDTADAFVHVGELDVVANVHPVDLERVGIELRTGSRRRIGHELSFQDSR